MKSLQKALLLIIASAAFICHALHEAEDALGWQDVYMVNNSDYTLDVAANVTGIQNINDVDNPQKNPVHLMKWVLPKRDKHSEGMIKLDNIDRLHNITIKPAVSNISQLPSWMQKPYPVPIAQRIQNKILMIYVGQSPQRWLIDQNYVESVKINSGGPSGYTVEVDQA